MLRKSSLLLAAVALVLMAPMANAAKSDWAFSLMGGLTTPVGPFSDEQDFGAGLGFGAGLAVDYMVTDGFALGVEGTFAQNNVKKDTRDALRAQLSDPTFDVKYTQFGGGVRGKYWLPMQDSPLNLYFIGGLGMASFKAEVTAAAGSGDQTKTGFTAKGGVGGSFKASENVGIGLEGTYNFLSLDKNDWGGTSSAPTFGINAVVTFLMGGSN